MSASLRRSSRLQAHDSPPSGDCSMVDCHDSVGSATKKRRTTNSTPPAPPGLSMPASPPLPQQAVLRKPFGLKFNVDEQMGIECAE